MKKLLALLLLLLLAVSPALAEQSRVIDESDVLSAADEASLEQAIALIAQEYQFDVILLSKESIGGRTAHYYAADYFMDNGFGYGENQDGIILILVTGSAAGDRDLGIASHGRGEKVFDIDEIYALEDEILPSLRVSNYSAGLAKFVTAVEARLKRFTPASRISRLAPVLVIIGLVIGLIVALVFKGQMKSARRKNDASSYVRDGSFHLSRIQDIYLYTTTTRRKIESSSSGGGSRGGGGFSSSSGSHFTGHSTKF